eukprot:gb/GEZN01014089.1/.p1 GENE.gb/GEZN01014089.1/~~gb/GEZN01014089.1/.p1  ORF type:complete len:227 (-),score=27.79 gb/GEZN01014089.1/:264-944(-)
MVSNGPPPVSPRRIMVLVDGSKQGNRAFFAALGHLRADRDVLFVVHAVELLSHMPISWGPGGGGGGFDELDNVVEVNKYLKNKGKKLAKHYLDICKNNDMAGVTSAVLCHHNYKEAILNYAKENRIGTIFVGDRGLGMISRLVLGSMSRFLLDHASCDVMVVKNSPDSLPQEIEAATKKKKMKSRDKEQEHNLRPEKRRRSDSQFELGDSGQLGDLWTIPESSIEK